jgi:hypothetical protein
VATRWHSQRARGRLDPPLTTGAFATGTVCRSFAGAGCRTQEQFMSKQSADPTFSPLLLLVPVPFVLATCLPLEIDHSRAADPKVQHVAAAHAETSDRAALEPAKLASQPARQARPLLQPR